MARWDVTVISEIAEKIRFARPEDATLLGRTVFLIGAGCSISARIPGAVDIAKKMVQVVAHCFGYCGENADPVKAYECFIESMTLSLLEGNLDRRTRGLSGASEEYRKANAEFYTEDVDELQKNPHGEGQVSFHLPITK